MSQYRLMHHIQADRRLRPQASYAQSKSVAINSQYPTLDPARAHMLLLTFTDSPHARSIQSKHATDIQSLRYVIHVHCNHASATMLLLACSCYLMLEPSRANMLLEAVSELAER